jgi:hypothetical protein
MKKALAWIAVIVVGSLLWAWFDLSSKPANERLQNGIQQILQKEPRVRPMYDNAMKDGILTTLEANAIVDKAVELKGR